MRKTTSIRRTGSRAMIATVFFLIAAAGCDAKSLENRIQDTRKIEDAQKRATELAIIQKEVGSLEKANKKYKLYLLLVGEYIQSSNLDSAEGLLHKIVDASNSTKDQSQLPKVENLEKAAMALKQLAELHKDASSTGITAKQRELYTLSSQIYGQLVERGKGGNAATFRNEQANLGAILANAMEVQPSSPTTTKPNSPVKPHEPRRVTILLPELPAAGSNDLAARRQGVFETRLAGTADIQGLEGSLEESYRELPGALSEDLASYLAARNMFRLYSWQKAQFEVSESLKGYMERIRLSLSKEGVEVEACTSTATTHLANDLEKILRHFPQTLLTKLKKAESRYALVLGESSWELQGKSQPISPSKSTDNGRASASGSSGAGSAESDPYMAIPKDLPGPEISLPILAQVATKKSPLDKRVATTLEAASIKVGSFAQETEKIKKIVRTSTDVHWLLSALKESHVIAANRSSLESQAAELRNCGEIIGRAVSKSKTPIVNAQKILDALKTVREKISIIQVRPEMEVYLESSGLSSSAKRSDAILALERMASDLEIRLGFKRKNWTEQKRLESMREVVGMKRGGGP